MLLLFVAFFISMPRFSASLFMFIILMPILESSLLLSMCIVLVPMPKLSIFLFAFTLSILISPPEMSRF